MPTTALLILDIQNFFIFSTASTLPHILRLIHHFRGHGLPVLFARHGHPPSDLVSPSPNPLVNKQGIAGSIAEGTEDWDLQPEIASVVDEMRMGADGDEMKKPGSQSREAADRRALFRDAWPVVHKTSYDAFVRTNLEEQLKRKGWGRWLFVGR